MIRLQYRFYGAVQGVGFRYRAKHAASLCGVTGLAENMWDGSVYMEAQGSREAIESMVQMIANGRFVEIERVEEKEIPVVEGERGFGRG